MACTDVAQEAEVSNYFDLHSTNTLLSKQNEHDLLSGDAIDGNW